jgi:hypothetical protein
MSGLLDSIGNALGTDLQQQLGQQIGADPQKTSQAIQAALPMLLAGLNHNASKPDGAASLLGALQRNHDGSLLDNLGGLLGGNASGAAADGAGILQHVLGDHQENAEHAIAKQSGLTAAQASQMLMALAPVVMGALGRMQRSQGLDAQGLSSVLKDEHAATAQAQPGLMGLASKLFSQQGADGLMKEIGSLLGGGAKS